MKRIIVAMSGGVDSSVACALLKEKGYEVIGVTMQIWERSNNGNSCCGLEAIESAKRVADKLDIPHYILNFRDVFKEYVFTDFCREYSNGRTPNPCIRCNQYIKFGVFLDKARMLDAEFIATGHYARIEYDNDRKRYVIKKGVDVKKDQSYVLYTMTQEQLEHTLMPLGELTKEETRSIARKFSLPVANRKESQEICFIPDNKYVDFLKKYIPDTFKSGPILNRAGKILGEHKGILSYTIGQREGLGISYKEPLYVININNKDNSITVGTREEAYRDDVWADNINYVAIKELTEPINATAKIRYLHSSAEAVVEPLKDGEVHLRFTQPQFAVTPGQAVVFYDNSTVLGGGTIRNQN